MKLSRIAIAGIFVAFTAHAQQASMTFFVTSVGKGNGADLGGLEGADAPCQALAKAAGSAIVGHHDLTGLKDNRHMKSWNSSHGSRGCSQDNLKASGGAGLVYCFVAN